MLWLGDSKLKSVRFNGMVAQIYPNKEKFVWRVMTDEQYGLACKNQPYNVYACGIGSSMEECMATIENDFLVT